MWLCAPGPKPHQSAPCQYARLWRERWASSRAQFDTSYQSKPARAEQVVGELVHVGLQVVVGCRHLAAPDLPGELRAVLDDQRIRRDVVGLELDGGLQRCPPVLERLPRRAVDEVEADVEPGAARGADGRAHVRGLVGAVERRQDVRDGRLHADRQPGDAGCRQLGGDAIRHRVGVRLDGDLGVRARCRTRRGRPRACAPRSPGGSRVGVPPPKNTVRGGAERPDVGQDAARELDLPQERVGVLVLPRAAQLARGVGVEVAVAAPHPAERDVQVDPELRSRRRSRPGSDPSRGAGSPIGSAEPIRRASRTAARSRAGSA